MSSLLALIFNIGNIAGGILLALAMLDKLDGEANFFNKIAKVLAPFQTIIGGGVLALGVLSLLRGGSLLYSLVSIIGGILLLTHVLGKAPGVGEALQKISDKLMPFKGIVGIALIIVGILGIL